MAISLSTLRRREVVKPPIIAYYGPGGVGKTTLAAGAPDPVVLAVEDGIGTLDVAHWPITSFADVMQAIGVLYSEEHDRKTLIVDSLDWLEPLLWAETCRKNSWASIEDAGYGKGYVAAAGYWRELIDGLRALRDERGMTIVLIAHNTIKRFDSPETEPYDRYLIKLHDRAANLVIEAADIVGFMNYRVSVAKTETGFNKKVARGVGGGQRVLHLEERPGFIAKNRFGLPASIDLPMSQDPATLWGAFAQHLPTISTPAAIAA
jgi:hypothetical protein